MINDNKTNSKIFLPFKALGYVCDHVPICLKYNPRLNKYDIITAVSKVIHLYKYKGLRLVSTSKPLDSAIDCLSADNNFIFVACSKTLLAININRGLRHEFPDHVAAIRHILPFGFHLITIDDSNSVHVWEIRDRSKYTEINFEPTLFKISAVIHPQTYLNKILLGSHQGSMELWNIKTNTMVYHFKGWRSKINVIEQSPAVDVMGIGMADGVIALHDIKSDETIMTFKQGWGPVDLLSFRTDGKNFFISGSHVKCSLAVWDLEERRLITKMAHVHSSKTLVSAIFIPFQPLLVTSSGDNSMKVWNFDRPDGTATSLHVREGHKTPINRIRFYDQEFILSSGSDGSFRIFSTIHEGKNKCFGLPKTMQPSPITYFDSSLGLNARTWDNIATCHRNGSSSSWNFNCQKASGRNFRPRAVALRCAISESGHFSIFGFSDGRVEKFNLQSGLSRGIYTETTLSDKNPTTLSSESQQPVNLLRIACSDTLVVTSNADNNGNVGRDIDGHSIKFWAFGTRKLIDILKIKGLPPLSGVDAFHRNSSLLALALKDYSILLVDISNRKCVRHFRSAHCSVITDLGFRSQDCQLLFSSSLDCTFKTWHIASSNLLDIMKCPTSSPIISFDLSPQYLVTAHLNDRYLYLWSDATLYKHVQLHPLSKVIDVPIELSENGEETVSLTSSSLLLPQFRNNAATSPSHANKSLINLSGLSANQIRATINLDALKMRNKMEVDITDAPFFLPSAAHRKDQNIGYEISGKEVSKIKSSLSEEKGGGLVSFDDRTPFGNLLLRYDAEDSNQHSTILLQLNSFGPSSTDLEIRLLSPENQSTSSLSTDSPSNTTLLLNFLKFLKECLTSKNDFDLVQTHLFLVIKVGTRL
ncbi:unnamed protein product [Gordionus sp. m RMFG-2023]